jgi:Pyruvate/2-oxoacid:ferredoxin oxidoreductase delta subunit
LDHRRDGVLRADEVAGTAPNGERLRRGPVVVIECVENIPCDPCVAACPKGAITIDGDINETPRVDYEVCDGCGVCLSACPGLAIFAVDVSGDGEAGTVSLPYEFLPLPSVGEEVVTLDRAGAPVGSGRVRRVLSSKGLDRTPIVTLELPKGDAMAVRHFTRRARG